MRYTVAHMEERSRMQLMEGDLFDNQRPISPEGQRAMQAVIAWLRSKNISAFSGVTEPFEDEALWEALPDGMRTSPEQLAQYVYHSSRFFDLIHSQRRQRYNGDTGGLFGEEVVLSESAHADGRTRGSERGYRIQVDHLAALGVDPKFVLFYRLTQPSDTPKPELYWTSDFSEVCSGLTDEVSGEAREQAIILVSDLETINKNGGLIQDINDDAGLAVRQISMRPFDQAQCLARF